MADGVILRRVGARRHPPALFIEYAVGGAVRHRRVQLAGAVKTLVRGAVLLAEEGAHPPRHSSICIYFTTIK